MVDPHVAMMHHPYLTVGGNIVQVVSEIILMQKKILHWHWLLTLGIVLPNQWVQYY